MGEFRITARITATTVASGGTAAVESAIFRASSFIGENEPGMGIRARDGGSDHPFVFRETGEKSPDLTTSPLICSAIVYSTLTASNKLLSGQITRSRFAISKSSAGESL